MVNVFSRSLISFLTLLFFINSLWASPKDHHPPLKWAGPSFSFEESEITAHPGEVVEVCVNFNSSTQVPRTASTVVEITSDDDLSLNCSTQETETLLFPFGARKACFDLNLNNDNRRTDYYLTIRGSKELASVSTVFEQKTAVCGVITHNSQSATPSESGYNVQDRFGNYYSPDDFDLSGGGLNCINSGYFNLIFTNGFTQEEAETICQVFSDISDMFSTEQTNIPIAVSKDVLENPNALAAATPLYIDLLAGETCGTGNNAVWEMVNTSNRILEQSPGFPAGILQVNSIIPNGYNWHTLDEDSSPTNPDVETEEYDLYSAILHEALHLFRLCSSHYD